MKCSATNKAGRACRAWAAHGSDKCNLHQPGAAKRLGAAGGSRRTVMPKIPLMKFKQPQTAQDMARLIRPVLHVDHAKRHPNKSDIRLSGPAHWTAQFETKLLFSSSRPPC